MEIDKVAVGKRIKNIRLEKGYSMKEFGIELGRLLDANRVKEGIISRWENGISLPNNERLKAIADFGDMTVDDLLHGNFNDLYIKPKIEKALNYFSYETTKVDKEKIINEAFKIYKENSAIYQFNHVPHGYIHLEEIASLASAFKKLNIKSEVNTAMIEFALLISFVDKILDNKLILSGIYSDINVSTNDILNIENVLKDIHNELVNYSIKLSERYNSSFDELFNSASDYIMDELDLLDVERYF